MNTTWQSHSKYKQLVKTIFLCGVTQYSLLQISALRKRINLHENYMARLVTFFNRVHEKFVRSREIYLSSLWSSAKTNIAAIILFPNMLGTRKNFSGKNIKNWGLQLKLKPIKNLPRISFFHVQKLVCCVCFMFNQA